MRLAALFAKRVALPLLTTLAMVTPAQAVPIVAATVTPMGGLYLYEYTITDENDTLELLIVSIAVPVAPLPGHITALTVPLDFTSNYDAGLGIVDFVSAAAFAFPQGGATTGFSFKSTGAPTATTFDALLFDGAQSMLVNQSGNTTGPSAVPEPALGTLLALGLAAATRYRIKRSDRRA